MSPLEIMIERRAAKKQELDELLALPTTETRDLTPAEDETFSLLVAEIRAQDERIAELTDEETRARASAEVRKNVGVPTGGAIVTDPPVYVRDGKNGNSYFRDLGNAVVSHDMDATKRLIRNNSMEKESRALGNTGAVGGSGGKVFAAV